MTDESIGGYDRRQTLKCMVWAGTGVVWTVAGGVPASRLIGAAKAAEGSFSFVQISDSHIGFAKPANPDARVCDLHSISPPTLSGISHRFTARSNIAVARSV